MINDGTVVGNATKRKEKAKGGARRGDGWRWRECNDKPTRACIPFKGGKRQKVIASHQCLGIEAISGIPGDYHVVFFRLQDWIRISWYARRPITSGVSLV